MLPKPSHLGPSYASQFADHSVAAAYHARVPYPPEFFRIFNNLHAPSQPRRILELGCGTGDVTIHLPEQAEHIDAIDPSAEMIAAGLRREGGNDPRINWVCMSAEDATFHGPYTLAVAAESLHWMEWTTVLPKIAAALASDAVLVLAERDLSVPPPWNTELQHLIARYSTNRDFRRFDLVSELTTRGLFTELGRRTTAAVPFVQSMDQHVEAMHSRNGFSRDRMDQVSAEEFDRSFHRLMEPHCLGGFASFETVVNVVWGQPLPVAAIQYLGDD